ncbi:YceI family protein [Polaromonas sp. JS666]|uniref:YceI family protein n=1 Tax=Polaromonas sp. (strain JS666 / ATCC BAA-500) TaxID=296591 RepID=UPI0000531C24|nr:YceI family protein [Polaromonas sp. JS666]ABE45068.1 YceI [Polaromonas sp. JS666]
MKEMKKLVVALLGNLFLASAFAVVDVYERDPDHTFAWFEFNHLGYSTQRDRFDKVDATITLDLDNQVGSVEVSIDVQSVSTGSLLFDQVLRSDMFFDAEQFPVITFKSSRLSFGKLDDVTAVEGNLTVKGITRPVTLTVTHFKCMMHPMLRKPACGLNATGKVKRSEFNLGRFVPLIRDEITLHVVMEALKR